MHYRSWIPIIAVRGGMILGFEWYQRVVKDFRSILESLMSWPWNGWCLWKWLGLALALHVSRFRSSARCPSESWSHELANGVNIGVTSKYDLQYISTAIQHVLPASLDNLGTLWSRKIRRLRTGISGSRKTRGTFWTFAIRSRCSECQ